MRTIPSDGGAAYTDEEMAIIWNRERNALRADYDRLEGELHYYRDVPSPAAGGRADTIRRQMDRIRAELAAIEG